MKASAPDYHKSLTQVFRSEYTRMIAVISGHFGFDHIELAEDIVSETFLKAAEVWQHNGVPDNPAAWLFTVARNLARDQQKRKAIFDRNVRGLVNDEAFACDSDVDFSSRVISDNELAMIFAVCDPVNSADSQICLALQILCGLSLQEIAGAFLTSVETIKKRLFRARNNLRQWGFKTAQLSGDIIRQRAGVVLNTLYLLFNEGYFSRSDDRMIRKELCSAAIRLALVLTKHVQTNTTDTHALLALMCFQSSRLDARADARGEVVLFDEQDRSLWNKDLIDEGNFYLVSACTGNEVSKYHLEAGIAYWHTVSGNSRKWDHILELYNELVVIAYSPVTALNRTFAFAKVYGNGKAIKEAEKLEGLPMSEYFALMGYLHQDVDSMKALCYYHKGVELARSVPEKEMLMKVTRRLGTIQTATTGKDTPDN